MKSMKIITNAGTACYVPMALPQPAHRVHPMSGRSTSALSLLLTLATLCSATPAGAVTFDCVINPSLTLKLGSPVATTLASIAVERGDVVHKGDVIARLESSVETADVALNAARAANTADIASHAAKVEFARAEAARGEELLPRNNIPLQKVEELRTNLRVAQADLQIAVLNHQVAELDLQRSKTLIEQKIIRSPIEGIVVQRMLGPGEFVHQDTQIVELAAISPLNVEAYPPIRYHSAVKLGASAVIELDEPQGSRLEATISVVDRVFDAGSGTFGVRLALPNPGSLIPGGQRCRLTLDVAEKK